ncbi:hypothetical protein [Jeotgalibacillus sp. JSM ZJ347]|uniref:hypothetical protein n=1 Tax=Jeotgalibacillus sp. JSM ZJ347 TaxID=3342117 RepID=UPI0035A849D0
MDKKRRETIVHEINYWKQNKLLPDAYCDFLMNLYTSGEGEFEEAEIRKKSEKSSNVFVSGVSLLGGLLAVIALVFGDLALVIQAVISILISAGVMIVSFRPGASPIVRIFSRIVSAFVILLLSVELWNTYYANEVIILYLLIGVQCILWTVGGLITKQHYFTVSGALGIVVLLILYF